MKFTIGMAFIFISLLFSIGLIVIYFSKNHVKNYETTLFSIFLLSNLVGLFLELSCSLVIGFYGVNSFISFVITKLFLIYLLFFGLLILLYVYFVCGSEDTLISLNEQQRRNRNIFIGLFIISAITILFLPVELKNSSETFYSTGPAVYFVFALSGIANIYCFLKFIFNIKILRKRKSIPLIVYITLAGVMALIQRSFPEFTVATSIETFMIFLMYNTIENPDIKLIQQLEIARNQADKANHAKTDFLSSMSHEIRTPLNAIVGFSEEINDAKTLDEAKENAHDIINASQTLLEIVNGILDISKIEAGKVEITNSVYNSIDTFTELAKLITPKMNEKGLDFSYYIAPDIPKYLYGDYANIKKIVTNLLSNACKYTDNGYVRYEVNCVNMGDNVRLIISVEDSGRGIKKESVDKLFTKFQRLDEDKNTTIEGTGLGLAITKQLIELMGGKIVVHTLYGEGSKFTVVLNQKIEKEKVLEEREYKSSLNLRNVKLLLVDDTPLNLKVATKLLQRYGADSITTVESGFECLDLIKKGEVFDVILLDDMMPKMSGVETLSKLREIPTFNIPVIALTANAISGMKEKYLADGFSGYLAKPIEREELVKVMNEVLGRVVLKDLSVINNDISIKQSFNSVNDKVLSMSDSSSEVITQDMKSKIDNNVNKIINDNIELLDDDISNIDTIPIVDIDTSLVNSDNECYDRSYLEKSGVDVNHALELLGDMDMYNSTVEDFLEEVDDKWNKIVEFKNSSNMKDYAIEVHSLKSDSKYLGLMDLADIAYQHELKSKENDIEFVLNNFSKLEDEFNKALKIIKNYSSSIKE